MGLDPQAAQEAALRRIAPEFATVAEFRERVPLGGDAAEPEGGVSDALAAYVARAGDRAFRRRRVAATEETVRRDVRVLVGSPARALVLVDRVERLAGRPIREVWPSWRGFVHGGVDFAPYAETWARRVGRDLVLVESWRGLAVGDGDGSLALVLDRAYFELESDGRRLGVHEAEVGVPYRLHVTCGDLQARATGDVVRFTSVRPPRIVVESGRFALDAFGERLTGEALEGAVSAAGGARGFAVEPEFPTVSEPRGRHLWRIECEVPPADLDAFARAIDAALQAASADYRAHRKDDALILPPRVRLVRELGP
jgi:hypothetical protein